MQKRPLLGLTLSELQNVVKNLGMPGFSAKHSKHAVYVTGESVVLLIKEVGETLLKK